MLFLLPIPASLVAALFWAWWVSRPPRPVDPAVSVDEWSRAVGVLAAGARTDATDRPLVRALG